MAYERGDYATALGKWTPLAKAGYAKAQYQLGIMYRHGRGVGRDYDKAAELYRSAAAQGHGEAAFRLGWLYHNIWDHYGAYKVRGYDRNPAEALRWYCRAAQREVTDAKLLLGVFMKPAIEASLMPSNPKLVRNTLEGGMAAGWMVMGIDPAPTTLDDRGFDELEYMANAKQAVGYAFRGIGIPGPDQWPIPPACGSVSQ